MGQVRRIEPCAGEEVSGVVQRHDDDDQSAQEIDRVQAGPGARLLFFGNSKVRGAANDGGLHTPPVN